MGQMNAAGGEREGNVWKTPEYHKLEQNVLHCGLRCFPPHVFLINLSGCGR